jgi:SAM-dependent methyltransferase
MRQRALPEVDGLCKVFSEFKMPPSGKILDLSCGIGRHAIPLAKKGYEVVGFDISPVFLNIAKQHAAAERLPQDRLRFYQGDCKNVLEVLSMKREDDFDAVINMFESHGYYGEKEDTKLFKQVSALASVNSLLIVQAANRDCLVRKFQPFGIYNFPGNLQLQETVSFDVEASMLHNNWTFYEVKPDKSLRLIVEVPLEARVYTLRELMSLLNSTDWKYVRSYGSIEKLGPLTFDSFHMIIVAKKS